MPHKIITATLAMQPNVIETYGGPEFYSDGAVFFPRHTDVMTSIFFEERLTGTKIDRYEVCRIHFSRSGWLEGLDRTNRVLRATILGGGVH